MSDETLRLRDGRELAYAEYGDPDAILNPRTTPARKATPGHESDSLFLLSSMVGLIATRFRCGRGGIRTHDFCLRRAALYPAELRVLVSFTHFFRGEVLSRLLRPPA